MTLHEHYSSSNISWHWVTCGMPNFSSSLFESFILNTLNRFDQLSNSNVSCESGPFFRHSGFLHQQNWPPWYNWNIAESGIKHHNHTLTNILKLLFQLILGLDTCSCKSNCHTITTTTAPKILVSNKLMYILRMFYMTASSVVTLHQTISTS
jgi:hypothetical protein